MQVLIGLTTIPFFVFYYTSPGPAATLEPSRQHTHKHTLTTQTHACGHNTRTSSPHRCTHPPCTEGAPLFTPPPPTLGIL